MLDLVSAFNGLLFGIFQKIIPSKVLVMKSNVNVAVNGSRDTKSAVALIVGGQIRSAATD